jgi:hypothetical protein
MRSWVMIFLAALAAVCGILAFSPENPPAQNNKDVPAVKIVGPLDLSGEWISAESSAGTKFLGHVKNNTILVEMSAGDGLSNLWYGTFDILQPGKNVVVSSAIEGDVFYLSSAKTKDFLYQNGSLVFDFSVMGTRTTIEMKRV